jgi:hypothetical protein
MLQNETKESHAMWGYNRNWMLLVGIIIALLIIIGVFAR